MDRNTRSDTNPMVSRTQLLIFLVCLPALCRNAPGDGLIYSLPPDGSWVTYHVQNEATEMEELDGTKLPDMTRHGTFTIRSVGTELTDRGNARWIELESTFMPTEEIPMGRIITLKMLIAEELLGRGSDPLSNVAEVYFLDRKWRWGQKPVEEKAQRLTDGGRVKYEVERFRPLFPFAPKDSKQVQSKVIANDNPNGSRRIEQLSYPTVFEGKLHGGRGGRWGWTGTYTIWISDSSPYGVIAVESATTCYEEYGAPDNEGVYQLSGQGTRMKVKTTLQLQAMGSNSKSTLPDMPNLK